MKKFLGEENIYDDKENSFGVLIPAPYEFSTSYGKGTSFGPEAIIEASQYVELYDEILDFEPYKKGIFTTNPLILDDSPKLAFQTIEATVAEFLSQKKFIVVLGGEHSISQAVYAAFNQKFADLSILQLDAHADLRDSYEGSKFSHASVMRRIWEVNKNIVQCGIRSLSKEEADLIRENKINTFFAHDIRYKNNWDEIIDLLKDKVFLTIDVDFFDPSIMPSTGTPEPGGFFWNETMNFLEKLFAKKNVVGCDVVELSPIKNQNQADFMIAKLVYKLFGYKLQNSRF
jgi:agmatinase